MLILVAGPYRSGTNDNPALIQANVNSMLDASLTLFRAGHLPVMGEWFALPLIEYGGSQEIGDSIFDEIFHPIARRLVAQCDSGCALHTADERDTGSSDTLRLEQHSVGSPIPPAAWSYWIHPYDWPLVGRATEYVSFAPSSLFC